MTRRTDTVQRSGRGASCAPAIAGGVLAALALRPAAAEPGSPAPALYDQIAFAELRDVEVVTATSTPLSLQDAPSAVTVVTGEELRTWGYESLAEALQHLAGLHLLDDHIAPAVSIRGVASGLRSESGLLKLMIDGRPADFRSSAGQWMGPELVPLTAIKRIEVVRGPASALYGADAFLGVINVLTLGGAQVAGLHQRLSGRLTGDRPGMDYDVSVGGERGRFELLAAARVHREDRSGMAIPAASPAPTVPAGVDPERERAALVQQSAAALLRLGYRLSGAGQIELFGNLSLLDRDAEFADWLQLGNRLTPGGVVSDNQISLVRGVAGLRYQGPLGRWQLDGSAQYFRGGPTGRDRIEIGNDLFYYRRDFAYQGAELAGTVTRDLPGGWSLLLAAGASFDREDLPSLLQVVKRDTPAFTSGQVRDEASVRQGSASFVNLGTHGQLLWQPAALPLAAVAGLRYDHHSEYASQLNGRLGLVLRPEERLRLKFLVGSAFKAPSPLLLHAVPVRSGDVLGNPQLEAQHIVTFETQLSLQATAAVAGSAGLAYSFLRNKAEFVWQGVNRVARNLAEMGALSFEAEAHVRLRPGGRLYGNVSWQRAERNVGDPGYVARLTSTGGGELVPSYVVNGGAAGEWSRLHVRGTVEASLVGPRRASDMNSLDHGEVYHLPTRFELGATISTMGLALLGDEETTFSLLVRNALGDDTPEPGVGGVDYPRTPRTVILRVSQAL